MAHNKHSTNVNWDGYCGYNVISKLNLEFKFDRGLQLSSAACELCDIC